MIVLCIICLAYRGGFTIDSEHHLVVQTGSATCCSDTSWTVFDIASNVALKAQKMWLLCFLSFMSTLFFSSHRFGHIYGPMVATKLLLNTLNTTDQD